MHFVRFDESASISVTHVFLIVMQIIYFVINNKMDKYFSRLMFLWVRVMRVSAIGGYSTDNILQSLLVNKLLLIYIIKRTQITV